jgi:CubicO group peptidase (beta-lactamase class C family)
MTSGFEGEDDAAYSILNDMFKTDDWLSFCLGLKLVKNPGEHYAYSSSSLTPLGAVLHLKSGLTIPEFAQKVLYDPLGITTHHWRLDSKGTADVEGSFWLKPRDLAKLGQLMLQKGKWNGKRIVSADWVDKMTTEKIAPEKIGGKMGYGYLWWTWTLPLHGKQYPGFYGLGRGGQNLIVFPGLDLVIVVTASNYYNDSYFNDSSNFVLKYIVPSLKY